VDTVILNLESSGFQSYRVKGYNTKAQALRANYVGDVYTRCIRLTPWHVQPTSDFSTQEAIVIGAGLAGCFIAHALAKRGWKIKLLDASDKPGSGASAIRQAVLYPKFSAYRSPLLEFMLSAYLYAGPVYKRLISEFNIGQLSGMLQLAYNPREARSQASIADWLKHYPELGELVDSEGASELLGILVYQQGLFIPDSGWVDSHALCQVLMAHPNIEWCPNTDISALSYEKELWRAGQHEAETVVIANGYSLNQFSQTEHLPIKKIRGQMTAIQATEKSTSLKIPVCADVHILPAIQGKHLLGASYHPGNASVDIVPHDDADNIRKLNTLASEPIWAGTVLNSWVGVRGAFPDYLPVVGPIAHADLFKLRLAGMATDSNRWIPTTGVFYPGLYACAGFGSRGLTTIPLSTEWLAGLINREPSCLSRSLEQAISPARFLMREIIRKPQEIS
jgi:tRNA 5-methylaminomethyl-2-thiouridine biosynthesis bifunctional protein